MKRIVKLTENDIRNVVRKTMNELNKSTYESAASKAIEKGDEGLAMKFLNHSNEMGIDDIQGNDYHSRGNRYMFFSNLEQMRRQCDMLLDMDPEMVEGILENGHDWAQDHISEAKNNMDQVFDFLMNETKRKGSGSTEDMMNERWTQKYKRSINCNNPKGFSQRAHCQGRKKK